MGAAGGVPPTGDVLIGPMYFFGQVLALKFLSFYVYRVFQPDAPARRRLGVLKEAAQVAVFLCADCVRRLVARDRQKYRTSSTISASIRWDTSAGSARCASSTGGEPIDTFRQTYERIDRVMKSRFS